MGCDLHVAHDLHEPFAWSGEGEPQIMGFLKVCIHTLVRSVKKKGAQRHVPSNETADPRRCTRIEGNCVLFDYEEDVTVKTECLS